MTIKKLLFYYKQTKGLTFCSEYCFYKYIILETCPERSLVYRQVNGIFSIKPIEDYNNDLIY